MVKAINLPTVNKELSTVNVALATGMCETSITNFHLLETKMSLVIPVLIKYDADPEMVERVLLEVANEARNNIPGISKEDEPVVRFKNFGEFGLEFILNCSIEKYDEQWRIGHELRKCILVNFQKQGIEIAIRKE